MVNHHSASSMKLVAEQWVKNIHDQYFPLWPTNIEILSNNTAYWENHYKPSVNCYDAGVRSSPRVRDEQGELPGDQALRPHHEGLQEDVSEV